ncbi:uncharacterized protein LOC144040071 [Vanacampus margaritifer]
MGHELDGDQRSCGGGGATSHVDASIKVVCASGECCFVLTGARQMHMFVPRCKDAHEPSHCSCREEAPGVRRVEPQQRQEMQGEYRFVPLPVCHQLTWIKLKLPFYFCMFQTNRAAQTMSLIGSARQSNYKTQIRNPKDADATLKSRTQTKQGEYFFFFFHFCSTCYVCLNCHKLTGCAPTHTRLHVCPELCVQSKP